MKKRIGAVAGSVSLLLVLLLTLEVYVDQDAFAVHVGEYGWFAGRDGSAYAIDIVLPGLARRYEVRDGEWSWD